MSHPGKARPAAQPRSWGAAASGWLTDPRAPLFALGLLSLIASVWFLLLTRGQYFFSDEWTRFAFFPNLGIEWSLHGTSGHLILVNILLYRSLLEIFGAGSYLPFKLLGLLLQIAAVWLLFLYLRRRVNPWLIVCCLAPLFFLGAAWPVTASAYGIVILTPIVLGLAALLALERTGRWWAFIASVLLVVAVLSHSGALPFLVGAAVLIWLSDPSLKARLWVVAPALLVYLAWFLWSRYLSPGLDSFEEPLALGNAAFAAASLVQGPAAALAAITGAFYRLTESGELNFDLAPGYLLLALAVVGVGTVWRSGRARISSRVLIPASMLVAFLILIAFGMSDPDRQPTSPRYLYFTVMCVVWILCEISPGIRWQKGGYVAVLAVFALGAIANASIYGKAANGLRSAGISARAALSALEVAGPAASPSYGFIDKKGDGSSPTRWSNFVAVGLQRRSIDRFGSAAYAPAELRTADSHLRTEVDGILIAAEAIKPARATGAQPSARCGWVLPTPGSTRSATAKIAPGKSLLVLPYGDGVGALTVSAMRFGTDPVAVGSVGRRAAEVSFPRDRSSRPWRATLSAERGARLCTVG